MENRDDTGNLKKAINSKMNQFFNEVLSLVQVMSKNEYQFNSLRGRILRSGNDTLREIVREVNKYEVSRKTQASEHDEVYDVE